MEEGEKGEEGGSLSVVCLSVPSVFPQSSSS